MILLEFEEDIVRKLKKREDFPNLDVGEVMEVNGSTFQLISIINFQSGHYKCHINGVNHSKLMPKHDSKWSYHDGKSNKGYLISDKPKFHIDISKDKTLPYILVYKML